MRASRKGVLRIGIALRGALLHRSPSRPQRQRVNLTRVCVGLAVLLSLGLLGACGPKDVPSGTGVRGTVLIGPMCPVIQMGTDCPDRPFAADLEVTLTGGRVVARSRSDFSGKFEIPLAAGEYVLVAVPPNPGSPPSGPSLPFSVIEGQWTTLTVSYDSGIR